MRDGHADHAAHLVGAHLRDGPRDGRAPVVTCDDGAVRAERVDEPDRVPRQVQDRVLVRLGGAAGAGVAALVGGDGVESGLGERGELVPPGVPAFGEAVQEQDERPFARLGDVHAQAALGLDEAMRDLGHR